MLEGKFGIAFVGDGMKVQPPLNSITHTTLDFRGEPSRGKLVNYLQWRGTYSTHPALLVAAPLLGLPFAAVGIFILFYTPASFPPASTATGWAFHVMFGWYFLAAGCFIAVHGIYRGLKILFKPEPLPNSPAWKKDYAWNSRIVRDELPNRALSNIGLALFIGAIMVPFHALAWGEGLPIAAFIALILCVFDGIVLYFLGLGLYRFMQMAKFRDSHLLLDDCPFYLGESLKVRWVPGQALGHFEKLEFVLHFYQQRLERDTDGESGATQATYELFRHSLTVDGPGRSERVGEFPLELKLPPDAALTTRLNAPTASFWELEIRANTPGIDYCAAFLVPVYSREREK